jgi:hypothetical protein
MYADGYTVGIAFTYFLSRPFKPPYVLFPANRGGGTPWQSMPTVIPSAQPKYSFTHCYFMRPLKKIPNLQLGGVSE